MNSSRFTVPILALVTAITVTVAVGGCTRSHPPRPAPTAARGVIAQDAASLQWSWLVGHAELQLVGQCMKDNGFAYAVPAPGPEPAPSTITADAIGSGGAATYGIVAPGPQPTDADAKLASYQHVLDGTAAEEASLTLPGGSTVGYQTGGCIGEARTHLFGSVRAYVTSAYLPQAVRDEFEAFLIKDSTYNSALRQWRSCMTQQHWPFSTPAAAISSLESPQSDLTGRQAAIAGADRGCDATSRLRSDRSQALTRFCAGLPSSLLADLDQVSADRVLAGRVAHTLIPSKVETP